MLAKHLSSKHPNDFIMESVKDKKITQAIIKHGLKSKNVKIKVSGMKTFAEIAFHYRKSIDDFLGQILPYIEGSVSENSNDLIQNSLDILKQAFRHSNPNKVSEVAKSEASRFSRFLTQVMAHSSSKVMCDAIKITGDFAMQQQSVDGKFISNHSYMLKSLYQSISQKLALQEIDQEVKQNSIISIAQILMMSH